jgi:pimeloyl-ACP methyl ester carboxylesterase
MASRSLVLSVLAVALVAATAAPASAATFQPGPCAKLPEPPPALETARCGTLTVPENRRTPTGRSIQLPVAILPAVSPNPAPDPIVYMEGGPGGPGIPSVQVMVDAGINRDREVIVMGERGTAYATPALICPEVDRFNVASAAMVYDAPSTGRKMAAAFKRCHDRLAADGTDLGAFNTTENAADFADLRVALGIPEWNVYGVSYGTDLALTYMREHPEGVRSVTIDSVVPPQLARLGLFWDNAGGGLTTIFKACRAQRSCRRAYPNPRGQFSRLVAKYEAHPLRARVKPVVIPGDKPEPGTKRERTVLDGGSFVNWTIGLSEFLGPNFPELLQELTDADPKTERQVLASWAASKHAHEGVYSFGLQNAVVCSEWLPYSPRGSVVKDGRKHFPAFPRSVLAQAPQFPFMREICDIWPVPRAPAQQHRAATGSIPTLVINGSYDAVTASQVARQAAKRLTNSTFVNVPGIGHYVVPKSKCAQRVMRSFVAALKPDVRCVAKLEVPRFKVAPGRRR